MDTDNMVKMISIVGVRPQLKLQAALDHGDSLITVMHSEWEWRKVRNEHIEHESCCQMCALTRKLEVHHVQPWHIAPDLRYDLENLITLCRECHFRFGHYLNWKLSNPEIRSMCKFIQERNPIFIGRRNAA